VTARLIDRGDADDAEDTSSILDRFAAAVRGELRLGSVAIDVTGAGAACSGSPVGPVTELGLGYQGRRLGTLAVTARPGERLSEHDRRMLAQVAQYLSVTAEAVRVSDDLRRAQQALEHAQLEERRRVRLDLHDGLGPSLASIHLRLLSLRRRLPADVEIVEIDDLVDQTADTIREVRRIVEGLQPSVLDDLGLIPALQILAADTTEASGIDVTVRADERVDDLPPHVGASVYRVVAEGLSNVVRHSRGSACAIELALDDDGAVRVAIRDDGCGFDPASPTGMGLRSIGERARASGGDVSITSTAGAGTTVAVRLLA
jgi:signal transduction histidine kinase